MKQSPALAFLWFPEHVNLYPFFMSVVIYHTYPYTTASKQLSKPSLGIFITCHIFVIVLFPFRKARGCRKPNLDWRKWRAIYHSEAMFFSKKKIHDECDDHIKHMLTQWHPSVDWVIPVENHSCAVWSPLIICKIRSRQRNQILLKLMTRDPFGRAILPGEVLLGARYSKLAFQSYIICIYYFSRL